MEFSVFRWLALVAIIALAALVLAVLFEPGLKYGILGVLPAGETHEFRGPIAALVDEPLVDGAGVEVLTDGKNFYDSELSAILAARQSIHIEAYVFHRSGVADRFVQVLEQRARAGVKVRLVIRLPRTQGRLRLVVDVFELGIAVRVACTLQRLAPSAWASDMTGRVLQCPLG